MISIRCAYDKLVPITDLKPHPKNRNKHPKEQLERLTEIIKYQGWRKPITVSNLSGFVTAGHGRLSVAKALDMKEVPVDYQDYESSEQEYADVQADNAIALWADLDLKEINVDLPELGPDFDIDMLGIEGFTLDVAEKGLTDDDAVPEKPPAVCQLGELWQLGDHRLLCGDCTVSENVSRLMGGEKADMVFTDPPYGVSYQTDMSPEEAKARNRRKDGKEVANDTKTGEELRTFLALALYGSPLKAGGPYYLCSPPGCTETDFRLSLGEEFQLRQALVWVKQQFVFGRQDYHWRHETILYGWREGAAHYFIDDRTQDTVWNFDRPFKSPDHPTMKPVELVQKALKNSSKAKENIYDCFLGSGSTLIACEKTGRRCFGMEIDPHYCDVIIKRWEDFTGQKAKRIEEAPV